MFQIQCIDGSDRALEGHAVDPRLQIEQPPAQDPWGVHQGGIAVIETRNKSNSLVALRLCRRVGGSA